MAGLGAGLSKYVESNPSSVGDALGTLKSALGFGTAPRPPTNSERTSDLAKDDAHAPGTFRRGADARREREYFDQASYHPDMRLASRPVAESLEVKGLRTELERLQRRLEEQGSNMKELGEKMRSMEKVSAATARFSDISAELASIKALLMTRNVEDSLMRSHGNASLQFASSPVIGDTPGRSSRHMGGFVSANDGSMNTPVAIPPSVESSNLASESSSSSSSSGTSSPISSLGGEVAVLEDTSVLMKLHHLSDEVQKDFESFVDAFKSLCESNAQSDLDKAKSVLQLYLSNIVKHPRVPRYRRISTANKSFKDMVAPLASHEKIFSSLGFQERGIHWEYRPSASDEEREKYVPLVDAARKMLLSAVAALAAATGEVPTGKSNDARDVIAATGLNTSIPLTTMAPSHATADPHIAPHDFRETETSPASEANVIKSKEITADATDSGDEAPATITEVYEMIQQGKKLPGVRKIPERLSSDVPSPPTKNVVEKPWAVEVDSSKETSEGPAGASPHGKAADCDLASTGMTEIE